MRDSSIAEPGTVQQASALALQQSPGDEAEPRHACNTSPGVSEDPLRSATEERFGAANLPPELLACVAQFLAPRELYAAALVCGHWRAALLGMPLLWTRVRVVQRDPTRRSSARRFFVKPVLRTLFRRSQGLPLDIEFSCEVMESLDEYNAVAATIKAELHRTRSLSLVLPEVKGTLLHILRTPAPILECFRLHSQASQMSRLPLDLFARDAPRLARVSLFGMILPFHHADTGCVALRAVTELVHDANLIDNSDLDSIDLHFPALRSLTLLGDGCDLVAWLVNECRRPIHLRVPNIDGVSAVLKAFPNAASICLCSSRDYWDTTPLESLADGLHDITSVAMCYRPKRYWDCPEYKQAVSSDMIAVSVNGRDVAVDLPLHEASIIIESLSGRLSDVQSISAHEGLWRAIALHDLPPLAELTLHVSYYAESDDEDDAYSAPWRWYAMYLLHETHGPLRKHETALLRLVTPPGSRLLALQEYVVVEAVEALCDPRTLRTLVLCDVGLDVQLPTDHPRSLHSLVPGLEVRYEAQGSEDRFEPWCWTMPVEDAVHV